MKYILIFCLFFSILSCTTDDDNFSRYSFDTTFEKIDNLSTNVVLNFTYGKKDQDYTIIVNSIYNNNNKDIIEDYNIIINNKSFVLEKLNNSVEDFKDINICIEIPETKQKDYYTLIN